MIRSLYRRIVPTVLRESIHSIRHRCATRSRKIIGIGRETHIRLSNLAYYRFRRQLRRPESYPQEVWDIEMNLSHMRRHVWLSRVIRGTVLDSGCGRGVATCSMARTATSVHGVDFDEKKIATLNDLIRLNEIRNVTCETGDSYSLPAEDDSFDTVTLLEVIEHLEQPGDAVAEALRVARHCVVITVPAHGHMTQVLGHIQDFSGADLKALLPRDGTVEWVECLPFQFVMFEHPEHRRDCPSQHFCP